MPIEPWLDLAGGLLGNLFGKSQQDSANRANLKLQREQQKWTEQMSNTAIQRRVADIVKAGGNPALAFTDGREATTPSVSPARMEPYKPDIRTGFTAAALAKAQIQNLNADSLEKMATARSKKVQADIDEASKNAKTQYTVNDFVERFEQSDLKTSIMRSLDTSSAAQAKKAEETVDSFIRMAADQAAVGTMNRRQLEDVIDTLGLGAEQKANILQKLMNIISPLLKD